MLPLPKRTRAAALATLALVASAAGAQTRARAHASGAGVAGSYVISVCPGYCDPASPPVQGVLVLFSRRMPVITGPPAAVRALEKPVSLDGVVNGCFAFAPVAGEARTLAGARPVGSTGWGYRRHGVVLVALFASVDAFHFAELRIHGDTLRGTGRSQGMVGSLRDHVDSIFGHRIGPPEVQRCVRAAEGGEVDTTLTTAPPGARVSVQVPGTYRIRICPTGCDPAHPPVAGYLVLLRGSLRRSTMRRMGLTGPTLEWLGRRGPNACYALERTGREVRTYAGIESHSVTTWSVLGDSIAVPLFASPDAYYQAILRPDATGLVGEGRSTGSGAADAHWPPDSIVAVRIGPPDARRCVRRGQREAAP